MLERVRIGRAGPEDEPLVIDLMCADSVERCAAAMPEKGTLLSVQDTKRSDGALEELSEK